ncbi:2OG-Fe(II) oxygenase [Pokkaliibacter sp. MBI-7]|uniref:2OG-Fe(II) oxygenase n=1 Tax=Pokkaliibacter sp. MBI-7 TaxID=3040600 RepID=UPI002449DFB4|nr:2OG-Fe(II) oxygenase [Pokkaliibacter sp. MBI-7]MDH2431811.1 2OG-Fe(II) oxygenase [Pokkaliibacter sp. MBI-7]
MPLQLAMPVDNVAPTASALARYDWPSLLQQLDSRGFAVLPGLLDHFSCDAMTMLYQHEAAFRSRVIMARHGFGQGEYQYFSYPLPAIVQQLRHHLYPLLQPLANQWALRLGQPSRFPPEHPQFITQCHQAGQSRPTPLLLRYGPGDYNCLHQDLYGEQIFPLQLAVLLSAPEVDFQGGEFVLTEQRPRMQSRVQVVALNKGDGVMFAVSSRPVAGSRGNYRAAMRHGVSEVTAGNRYTLGIIFHDAQ